jgi:hypothetical protein
VPMHAVCLCSLLTVPLGVACAAHWLDIVVMLRRVSRIVIVLVSSFSRRPLMTAVRAWKGIWMGTPTFAHFYINPLSGLFPVTVSRQHRNRPWASCERVHSIRHALPNSILVSAIGVHAFR